MHSLSQVAFILFLIKSTIAQTLGDLENTDITECGKLNYPIFINGIDNLVETSDPLSVDLITANLIDLKYQLKHASLTGMKQCTVTTLKVNRSKLTFQYNLECPNLKGNAELNLTGHVATMFLEGAGNLKFTCDDCLILLDGNYEKNIGGDQKQHFHIQNYNIDLNARGRLTINVTNSFENDKEKYDAINKILNDNGKYVNEIRAPVLRGYMDVFFKHLNEYLQLLPIDKGCVLE